MTSISRYQKRKATETQDLKQIVFPWSQIITITIFQLLAAPSAIANTAKESSAEIWLVRQKHGSFGRTIEYLDRDRFKIEFLDTNIVVLADAKAGSGYLWNKESKLIYKGPLSKISLPLGFLTKATSDLDGRADAWKQGKAETLDGIRCSVYTEKINYEVRQGKGWISTGRRPGKAVGKLWYNQGMGLSENSTSQLCRILLFPNLHGLPVQLTTTYGNEKAFKSFGTNEILRVKEPVNCFTEPKNYRLSSDLTKTLAQDNNSIIDLIGN